METNDIIRFVSDGFDKAKAGAATEIYNQVVEFHNQNLLPLKSHYAFGWIIYYALHQSPSYEIKERKRMLARYLNLSLMKPHKLHSMILTEAIKLAKDASDLANNPNNLTAEKAQESIPKFSLVKFTDLWNLSHLRPGDWRRKEHEGKKLPSTVEKLITQYVDELYTSQTQANAEFTAIVERALTENTPTDNLYAQRARLHQLSGNRKAARESITKAILASSTKFHLWVRLAELLEEDAAPRLTISLLYKAICCPGQEEFKGRIHLRLAKILADAGSFPQAKWELEYMKTLYQKNGWNLPRLYREIEKRIPDDTIPSNPTAAYRKVAHLASDLVYESLPEVEMRKNYHKPAPEGPDAYGSRRAQRAAWRVIDGEGNTLWLQPAQFGIDENLPMGTALRVKVFGGKVVKAALLS